MYPSFWQILLVLLVVLLLFGHKRIRELGKALGEALRDFRKGLEEERPPKVEKPPSPSKENQ